LGYSKDENEALRQSKSELQQKLQQKEVDFELAKARFTRLQSLLVEETFRLKAKVLKADLEKARHTKTGPLQKVERPLRSPAESPSEAAGRGDPVQEGAKTRATRERLAAFFKGSGKKDILPTAGNGKKKPRQN